MSNSHQTRQVQYAGGPIYCLAILGFKVSLLASYLRVAGFNRTYARVLYAVMGSVIINQLLYTFLLSFACRPVSSAHVLGFGFCLTIHRSQSNGILRSMEPASTNLLLILV